MCDALKLFYSEKRSELGRREKERAQRTGSLVSPQIPKMPDLFRHFFKIINLETQKDS